MEFMGELGLMKGVKKFGEKEGMDRFRAVSSVSCCISAVDKIENGVLSDPYIRNYKLVPKKKEKCVEVSNGLRME